MTRVLCAAVTVIVSLGAARPDLTATVTDDAGKPIAGATAYVYTARVKTGSSPYCPSCYADCGKTAKTDAAGAFTIKSLDPELIFRILVVAEGYKPTFVNKVDPAGGAMSAKLAALPGDMEPSRVLRGVVLDPEGNPVVGATVTPDNFRVKVKERPVSGSAHDVDPLAVTNERGEYRITSDIPLLAYDVKVEARGLATQYFKDLRLDAAPPHLRLGRGAMVVGRVMKEGKPLAGVLVGLVQENRRIGSFTGPQQIGTDENGHFTFTNVAPAGEWFVYGIMSSVGEPAGSIKTEKVVVDGEGTTADAGDLTLGPSHTLSGRVVLSDGAKIPPNTRIIIGRDDAWDSQIVTLDEHGGFTARGLPPEVIHVSLRVKGYKLSERNRSLDPLNWTFLEGLSMPTSAT